MLRISLLAPLVVAAVIAGCGSSSSSSTSSSSTASPSSSSAASTTSASSSAAAPASGAGGQLTLSETEFKITPASPSVAKTGTITITVRNDGKAVHALAVQTPSGVVATSSIAAGATATLKVNASKAGKYTFYCPIPGHRALGMVGTLTVGGSGASAAGAVTQSSSRSSY